MHSPVVPYQLFPLGDAAITIDFGNRIDEGLNSRVISLFHDLEAAPLPGMTEAVPAYSSLTIYYDPLVLKKKTRPGQTVFEWMQQQVQERLQQSTQQKEIRERLIKIPVCYDKEFAMDMDYLAATNHISREEIIQTHTGKSYKVFMLGFLPGFTYMGEVDEKIAIPRKPQPVPIAAGSVGIAGKQTGIYPLPSPGGWQIIGRTPLRLFNPEREEPILLQAGDTVQFYSITKNEFEQLIITGA